jgi:bifunctional non-homologous end joining protein LigD
LVDYLDAVRERILPQLRDRPLSVIRVLRGQRPFMQKNLPKYTPEWVRRVPVWAEASHREVSYALCDDRRTLLWFANQRAVEYHPTLSRADRPHQPTHLVLDLDPPEGAAFSSVVRVAALVRQALADAGLAGAVKTSGAKGPHVFVPVDDRSTAEDLAGSAAPGPAGPEADTGPGRNRVAAGPSRSAVSDASTDVRPGREGRPARLARRSPQRRA